MEIRMETDLYWGIYHSKISGIGDKKNLLKKSLQRKKVVMRIFDSKFPKAPLEKTQ